MKRLILVAFCSLVFGGIGGAVLTAQTTWVHAQQRPAQLIVFTRGADGLLYYKLNQNGDWTDWQHMSPPPNYMVLDSPSVVSQGNGQIDLFVRGGDNALWHRTFRDNQWSSWESLGGVLTSGPGAAVIQ